LHRQDLHRGLGRVFLPDALDRKRPEAAREGRWQYVFLAATISRNPRRGERHPHHAQEGAVSRAITAAVRRAGLTQRAPCPSFRHSLATPLLEGGYDIRTVQELLGHEDVRSTMISTHVLNKGGQGAHSPLDP
jgi:site-specific recombinase XerD